MNSPSSSSTVAASRLEQRHSVRPLLRKFRRDGPPPWQAGDVVANMGYSSEASITAEQTKAVLKRLLGMTGSNAIATPDTMDALLDAIGCNEQNMYHVGEVLQCWRLWMRPNDAPRSCLLVVDLQHDFIDGALALKNCPAKEDGAEVIPVINRMRTTAAFDMVALTQDWHPRNHVSFHSQLAPERLDPECRHAVNEFQIFNEVKLVDGILQKLWPDHCVQNTAGAEISPALVRMPSDEPVKKGASSEVDSYSAFWDNSRKLSTGLADKLREAEISRLFVCGLAFDFCVGYSALDAAEEGFETYVVTDACRSVDPGSKAHMIQQLQQRGVRLVTSDAVAALVCQP